MEDNLLWFRLQVYYPITSGMGNEEVDEIDQIRMKNEGVSIDYEVDDAYFSLGSDPIMELIPSCFIPKGKTHKKYYTIVLFESGNSVMAVGKPSDVYDKLNVYLDGLPISEDKKD